MRRLSLILAAAALLFASTLPWTAEATVVSSAAAKIKAAVQSIKPLTNAACRGTGAHCPPGYVWNGNRCVPC